MTNRTSNGETHHITSDYNNAPDKHV